MTRLLNSASAGDDRAARELYERIYDELHGLADAEMQQHGSNHTLQPTALVNEAWLRLAGAARRSEGEYRDRNHFLAVASRAMRSALVDEARRRASHKRGGGHRRVPLEVAVSLLQQDGLSLLALDDALERLASEEPRQAQVVELRFFGGLSLDETADSVGISRATVERDWSMARVWLREELRAESA